MRSPSPLARFSAALTLLLALAGGYLFAAPGLFAAGLPDPPFNETPTPAPSAAALVVPYSVSIPLGALTHATASAGDVLVNEVVTDPQTDWSSSGFDGSPGAGSASETDAFVELYIKTAGLDLAGWTISLEDSSPHSGDLTSAGAFQTARYVGAGSFHATAAGDYMVLGNPQGSAALNNEILIVLKDNQNTVIDQVQLGAGGAPNGAATGPDDESVSRVPNGHDSNDDAGDFVQQVATPGRANLPGKPPPPPTPTPTGTLATPTPTASATPGGPFAAGVLLNEFLPHPGSGAQEFIELINLSAQPVDLGGWMLDDAPGGTAPYTLPGGTLIGPGGLLFFEQSLTGVGLNDDGDTARLLRPDGSVADEWSYQPAPPAGTSWARVPDGGGWNGRGIPSPGGPNQAAPGPAASGSSAAIGELRGWPDGAWVSLTAYVSVPAGVFSRRTIHIQDASGGLTVYLGRDDWPPLAIGQPIRLLGTLRHRSGELELYVRNGWHIGAGSDDARVALPPMAVVTGQVGEGSEGALVIASGRVTQLEDSAFWIEDGSGAARVFFAAATGLARPPVSVGQTWQVTGVVVENTLAGSTGPRYRLQPRFAADLAQIVDGQVQPYLPVPPSTPDPTATPEATDEP